MHAPPKDENQAHPVADVWRPVIQSIVMALVEGDYELARGIPFVEPPLSVVAEHAQQYVADFGETLAELPEESWKTSQSQWMAGYWQVLVDLWTVESGDSDLVLFLRVYELGGEFKFTVDSLHVP
jgi:hypothetical protein